MATHKITLAKKLARRTWTFTGTLSKSLDQNLDHPLSGMTPEERTELRIQTLAKILVAIASRNVMEE